MLNIYFGQNVQKCHNFIEKVQKSPGAGGFAPRSPAAGGHWRSRAIFPSLRPPPTPPTPLRILGYATVIVQLQYHFVDHKYNIIIVL